VIELRRSALLFALLASAVAAQPVLRPEAFRHYIDAFNRNDDERFVNYIDDRSSWEWLQKNIPLFECSDKNLEKIYYFRWWTFRKHIKKIPDGFVITEFLPPVPWAGKYNTISCSAGHHFYEGRWLRDREYLDSYARFWFGGGGELRRYSFWAADSLRARAMVTGDQQLPIDLLPGLVENYRQWEQTHQDANGLFWQIDDRDGMEVSIGGSGYRATINSYMFYIGFRDVDHAQIGLARSRDGITGWQRHRDNPIVRPGQDSWDHDACYKPFAIFDGTKWLLWYNGRHGSLEQIGLVLHEGEDLGFDK